MQKPRVPNAGSFPKGKSGNPGGPPKGLLREIRDQFGADVPRILAVFRDLAIGIDPKGYTAEIKTADRIKAGAEVLDRLGVKPPTGVNIDAGVTLDPQQLAYLGALHLTPHERRQRLERIAAEDDAALADDDAGED